jgi:hypothetical protein
MARTRGVGEGIIGLSAHKNGGDAPPPAEEFKAWYEELSDPEQNSVERMVLMLMAKKRPIRRSVVKMPASRDGGLPLRLADGSQDAGPRARVRRARAVFEIAQQEAEKLDQIHRDLKNGNDSEALNGMRKFFNRKKPATREKYIAEAQAEVNAKPLQHEDRPFKKERSYLREGPNGQIEAYIEFGDAG